MKQKIVGLFFVSFLFSAILFGQDNVTTILLVRHAEKVATTSNDPALSEVGNARAAVLVRVLENSGLTAVYSSQYVRTKQTAEPVARKFQIPVQTVDAASSSKLVETILTKHPGGTVLVVGHSNTLPEIVQALGAGKLQDIADTDYDNLYIVTVSQDRTAKLLRLKFFNDQAAQVCQ